MILKKSVTIVILCVAYINGVFGTSYSKVYVNTGTHPYEYVGYGAPAVAYGAPIAQLSAPPVQSVAPYHQAASFVAPCVSPCVPQQPVAQVANAGLVAYTAARAPVVVAGDVPSNYEYSYVVYDDGTGDQKAARELSDGGVVRGQYSFLQPDGYVREVQYTADDATGFNAVVNYLPGGGEKTVEVKEAPPCTDVKSKALKQKEESPNSGEIAEVHEKEEHKSVEKAPASAEVSSEKHAESISPEDPAHIASVEEPAKKEACAEEPHKEETSVEAPHKEDASVEAPHKEEASVEAPHKEEASVEEPHKEEASVEEPHKAVSTGEVVAAEVKEENPHAGETTAEHAEHAVVEAVPAPQPVPAIVTSALPAGYVSYDQLLKCIQKIQNANLRTNSPLTYILLPSNSKPC